MTQATSQNYWIAPNALYIERNARENPDCIQASCVSGAQILVYIKDIIGYDAGHNYQRWTLQAAPTVFNTHTAKYVYAAVPRPEVSTLDDGKKIYVQSTKPAIIVYPSEKIDIYGTNAAGTKIGSDLYYYIFLGGILTSSGDNGTTPREWLRDADGLHTIATGYLSSDEAIASPTESEWYKYSSVDRIVTFLKDLTMKAGTWFLQLFAKIIVISSGGSIRFGESETAPTITGVAVLGDTPDGDTSLTSEDKIVTPAYGEKQWLSKRHDDKTDFGLEMARAKVNGNVDVFGNLVVEQSALLKGDATVSGSFAVGKDLTIGTYNKGIEGSHVDFYGNAEFESIVARTFLEVPELRKSRTTITVGNKWQTVGAGLIEEVWTKTDNPELFSSSALGAEAYEGIAKLKLEPGEPGAIALNDLCQGVYSFGLNDSTETSDPHNGNFLFKGCTTVYFKVVEIYTASTLPPFLKERLTVLGETPQENQYFRYELRAKTCAALPLTDRNRWTNATHPALGMHFAAYANPTNKDRQASRLTTTTYQLHLAGMTDWTYTQDNIRIIIGWLDGFTFRQRVWDKDSKTYKEIDKPLHGEGIAVGNIYMWGNIDQFDRAPSVIAQQLYYKAASVPDASASGLTPPESILISTDHSQYNLNGWRTEPILPSPENRYVYQQWLYTYSDGTYDVSTVSLHSVDTTALSVLTNRNIISVALSDFYDIDKPDTVTFDIEASLLCGDTPIALTSATAEYQAVQGTMTYTVEIAEDGLSAIFHISIEDFVGVAVDGATPEDTFLHLTLTSDAGTATSVVTIAQNREGDDGEDGEPGEDAIYATLTVDTIVIPTVDGDVAEGAVTRSIIATIYKGNTPLTPVSVTPNIMFDDGFMVNVDNANTISIIPLTNSPWTDSNVTLTIVARDTDNKEYTRQKTIQITGSAQGQTIVGPQGASVTNIAEQWQATVAGASASALTENGWQDTHIDPTPTLPIVWNREIVTFYDQLTNTTRKETIEPHICCEFSDGLLKHESLYLVKDDATVPEESSSAWTDLDTAMSRFSADNRYFWNKETVEYKDSSKNHTDIRLVAVWGEKGESGEPGYDGCLVRRTEWQAGVFYRNDADIKPAEGQRRYIDEVSVTNLATGEVKYYLATAAHNGVQSSDANKPILAGNDYWQPINDLRPLRTSYADIARAFVQFLQVNQIVITDPQTQLPYAAFGAVTDSNSYPLWLGATEPSKAPFWVNANGEVSTTMIRRQMEFWDMKAHAYNDDYEMSTYLKKYCPSYIRASVYYEDDSGRTIWRDGTTSLVRQEPRRYIVLPYAGHVLGKEVEIVVPNCFHNAANRGVIAISALSGQGQTPVLLNENQEKVYRPFDSSKSTQNPWGVEPGYAGLDFAVAEGNDGYFRSINGFWRSMILMDCVPDEWRVKANNTPRQYDDQTGIPDEDIYDRTSYVRLYATTQTLNGIKVPCWYIIESRNVKIIDQAGAVPVV